MNLPTESAEDFASWVAENKPHLLEIEEEIQKIGLFGEIDIRVTVRGGQVEKLGFYGGRTWLKDKSNLTQRPPNGNK
jgi:hypothetical protein